MADPKKPDLPEFKPHWEEKDKDVELTKIKQTSLDRAYPKLKNAITQIDDEGGPEKYKNDDLVLRLVGFVLSCTEGKHGVIGKSPAFILERLAASMNATAPHVVLDSQLKRFFDEYKTNWLTVRKRV